MDAFVLLSNNYPAVGFLLVWTNHAKLASLQKSVCSVRQGIPALLRLENLILN